MKGIILAGGEGKRLLPLTLETPKPLITVKKKPLVNYNLDLFKRYDVDDVKILVRPADREDYRRWYAAHKSDFPKMKIEVVEEKEPMGTFGYLFHYLRSWMGQEDIFVTNGDDIKNIDLRAMLAFHKRSQAPATVALMKMEEPGDYGAVLVSADRVVDFLEKQKNLPAGLVSTGMYVISPAAIERVEADTASKGKKYLMFEKDLFPSLAKAGGLSGFVCKGTFFDCGTLERWEKAIREA